MKIIYKLLKVLICIIVIFFFVYALIYFAENICYKKESEIFSSRLRSAANCMEAKPVYEFKKLLYSGTGQFPYLASALLMKTNKESVANEKFKTCLSKMKFVARECSEYDNVVNIHIYFGAPDEFSFNYVNPGLYSGIKDEDNPFVGRYESSKNASYFVLYAVCESKREFIKTILFRPRM